MKTFDSIPEFYTEILAIGQLPNKINVEGIYYEKLPQLDQFIKYYSTSEQHLIEFAITDNQVINFRALYFIFEERRETILNV